ncbi:MAG: hypothetical protein H0T42_09760 [Deltaproteobacteria bacterium]|nr:hypothetical protein [Deltaproteobacteria bacterium]
MRRAFAACIAFAVLMGVVVIRFGFRNSPSTAPEQPIVDAAIADAPIDAVVPDAAPTSKKSAPKPKPRRPATKPTPVIPTPVIPTPVIPTPVIPTPFKPRCTPPPNPAGCPAKEPNVNRPCDAEGVHCVYGTSCCPFVYVCNGGVFEARFTSCP